MGKGGRNVPNTGDGEESTSSSRGSGGTTPLQQPSGTRTEKLAVPEEETDEQIRAELEAFLDQASSGSKKQATKTPRVKTSKKKGDEQQLPTPSTTTPSNPDISIKNVPRVAKIKRDFIQYHDLKKTTLLSNGKTVEQFTKETLRCNYCNVLLAHDLTEIPKKERRTKRFKDEFANITFANAKSSNDNDNKDINGTEKSPWQRSPIVEHVFPKNQVLEFGLEKGEITPKLWDNFIKDADGLKVCCRSCNSEKQDKALSSTPDKNHWWPKMAETGNELLEIYNMMKAKYGFKGPPQNLN